MNALAQQPSAARAAEARPVIEFQRRRHGLSCPHCGSVTTIRTSELIEPTFCALWIGCKNVACGYTFKASLSHDYGISPSGIPNPDIDLPMRPMERIPGETIAPATGPPEPDPNQPTFFD